MRSAADLAALIRSTPHLHLAIYPTLASTALAINQLPGGGTGGDSANCWSPILGDNASVRDHDQKVLLAVSFDSRELFWYLASADAMVAISLMISVGTSVTTG